MSVCRHQLTHLIHAFVSKVTTFVIAALYELFSATSSGHLDFQTPNKDGAEQGTREYLGCLSAACQHCLLNPAPSLFLLHGFIIDLH